MAHTTFTKTVTVDTRVGDEYSWRHWNSANLRFGMPQEKALPETAEVTGVYYLIAVMYDYGTPEKPDVRPMKIELPECNSYYGKSPIITKKEKERVEKARADGRPPEDCIPAVKGYTFSNALDCAKKTEHERVRQIFHEMYIEMIKFLSQERVKMVVGAQIERINTDSLDRLSSEFTEPNTAYPLYYRKVKKGSLKNAEGARPMVSCKVKTGEKKSSFTTADKPPKEVTDLVLTKYSLDNIAMVEVFDIFIGAGGARYRITLDSTIVTRAHPRSNVTQQGSTLDKLAQARANGEELVDLARQIELFENVQLEERKEIEMSSGAASSSDDAGTRPGISPLPGGFSTAPPPGGVVKPDLNPAPAPTGSKLDIAAVVGSSSSPNFGITIEDGQIEDF